MHELTDGGSAQYKSRNCMDDVSRIHGVIRLLENFPQYFAKHRIQKDHRMLPADFLNTKLIWPF
jgi:hypothetical protein